jgi:hypothetical protein
MNQTINNLNVSNSVNTTNLNCDNVNCDNLSTDNFTTQNVNLQTINNSITAQNLLSLDTTTSLVLQLANLKTYIDNQISLIFNNPDINLNSIVELANSLQGDKQFAQNMLNSLADKISLTSNNQTITGNNLIFNNAITTPNVLIKNDDNTTTSLNTQISNLQLNKANISDVNNSLALKANTSDVNTSLALKANTTDVNNSLDLKANTSYVNTSLALKANTTDVNTSLALKANTSDLTTTNNNLTTLQNDHALTKTNVSWLIGTVNANWANINNILLPDNTSNIARLTSLESTDNQIMQQISNNINNIQTNTTNIQNNTNSIASLNSLVQSRTRIVSPFGVGCYLLDGAVDQKAFNKYPVFSSEGRVGTSIENLVDALILMPGYGCIVYADLNYTGNLHSVTNAITNTSPLFVPLAGTQVGVNTVTSIRLFRYNYSTTLFEEVSQSGIS